MTLCVSDVLFACSAGLVLADGIITTHGLSLGLHEINPILTRVIGKLGLRGLWATRFVALFCLYLLFLILTPLVWIAFGSAFVVVMAYVVARGVRKLKRRTLQRTPGSNG